MHLPAYKHTQVPAVALRSHHAAAERRHRASRRARCSPELAATEEANAVSLTVGQSCSPGTDWHLSGPKTWVAGLSQY